MSAAATPSTATAAVSQKGDPCSYANPSEARVIHTDLEIDIDFSSKTLDCWARHTVIIQKTSSASSELILDTKDLTIHSTTVNGTAVQPTTGTTNSALGTALHIPLPQGLEVGTKVEVELRWTTSPDAVAVQWLAPESTAGKQHPFLFTQCQAIHARSLAPLQDTPGTKFTYNAVCRVVDNNDLVVLMSALRAQDSPSTDTTTKQIEIEIDHLPERSGRVFSFVQPQPLSSYLLAIAVGDLVSEDLSDRSRVWAEPCTVKAAAYEFADTPRFLDAAEEIAGPYRWLRYDLLLLPPAFPYGGMENCNMTFVTPTLLAGDRSLANVVAHEAAHSWTGNLVTNQTWEAFFLNEGWTVWLERRIMGRLHGEKTFQFHASLGWGQLKESVRGWGDDHPYTCLVPDLSGGVDPDDCFSRIPYEKGFALLAYLENIVGKDTFEAFFKSYVVKFAAEPVTPQAFKDFFLESFAGDEACGKEVSLIDWDAWYYATGMPPVSNTYDTSLADQAYALATRWHCSDVMGLGSDGPAATATTAVEGGKGTAEAVEGGLVSCTCTSEDLEGWSSEQIVAFLDKLMELRSATPMHPRTISAMQKAYADILENTKNSEIRSVWYRLRLKAGDESVLPLVEGFLAEQGRMKFLRPTYKALFRNERLGEAGKQRAREIYEKCKGLYHPIAAKMVAADLELTTG